MKAELKKCQGQRVAIVDLMPFMQCPLWEGGLSNLSQVLVKSLSLFAAAQKTSQHNGHSSGVQRVCFLCHSQKKDYSKSVPKLKKKG